MAKMFTITGKKAVQGVYLAHAAYESAKALATAHNGKIASSDGKMLEVNFKSNTDAKAFANAFESEYTKAHKAYAKAHTQKPKASKPTATKGKNKATASSPKKATAPKKAKGNAFDYSVIKGNSNSDKNKALHKVLVEMGIKDSRTPEYMSVWNARPWAK
jgi:hypothetical protein